MTGGPAAVPHGAPRVVIVTGMSGAGRSTAARALEDIGWFVVDNLPPGLLATMVDLGSRSGGGVEALAVVADVRSRRFTTDLKQALDELGGRGIRPSLVFLEASTQTLVRRFEGARRPHPLAEPDDVSLTDVIERERFVLATLRGEADLVVDTTSLNVHELRAVISQAFALEGAGRQRATVVSFGFKHGLPLDADLVVDCRFLPNPHWVPELRPHSGLDEDVRSYVLGSPDAGEFVRRYDDLLGLVLPGFAREGKPYLTVAVGCTGGRHRSVAIAEALGSRLRERGVDVRVSHRDVDRE